MVGMKVVAEDSGKGAAPDSVDETVVGGPRQGGEIEYGVVVLVAIPLLALLFRSNG